jgi:hypothetical protein
MAARRDCSGPALILTALGTAALFLWIGLAPEHAFGLIVGGRP